MSFSFYLEMKYSMCSNKQFSKPLTQWHSIILVGFMHNWKGFLSLDYTTSIPTDLGRNHQRKVIPRVILPNQTVGFLMSIFGKWNEQIICKLFLFAYYKPSNVCRLCEFFRVFRGVLGMKTPSLLCFLGRTMTLPNCGAKPVRSQQDWMLVRRNSWNCPSTLCHTRNIIITHHCSRYVYLGIFTNHNYPVFMFQCFLWQDPTIMVWSLRHM